MQHAVIYFFQSKFELINIDYENLGPFGVHFEWRNSPFGGEWFNYYIGMIPKLMNHHLPLPLK